MTATTKIKFNQYTNPVLCSDYVSKRQSSFDVTSYEEFYKDQLALLHQVKAGKPVYVEFHTGARKGSIARIYSPCVLLKSYNIKQYIHSHSYDREIPSNISEIGVAEGKNWMNKLTVTLFMKEYVEFDCYNLVYEFDGRKSVKSNYNDQQDMKVLLDYEGPTVYVYTQVDAKTKEEKQKAKLAKAKEMIYTPIDAFGKQVKQGDYFMYGTSGEICFGELLSVNSAGWMFYRPLLGGSTRRAQGSDLVYSIKTGTSASALIRFQKGECLADMLMMEKLKRI